MVYSSNNVYIDWLVQAFNRKYPNVRVVHNLGSNDDSNSLSRLYSQNLGGYDERIWWPGNSFDFVLKKSLWRFCKMIIYGNRDWLNKE